MDFDITGYIEQFTTGELLIGCSLILLGLFFVLWLFSALLTAWFDRRCDRFLAISWYGIWVSTLVLMMSAVIVILMGL